MHAFATFKSLLSRPSKSFQERKSCVWKTNMTPEPTKNPLYEFYYLLWHILTLWKYTNSLLPLARNVITKMGIIWRLPTFFWHSLKTTKPYLWNSQWAQISSSITIRNIILLPWQLKKLSSEVGPPQLMEYKVKKKVN